MEFFVFLISLFVLLFTGIPIGFVLMLCGIIMMGYMGLDDTMIMAQQMIDGGPSVLYDAVAILASTEAVEELATEATARDFVADAFQHCKFIGHVEAAMPLLKKAGIADSLDEGVIALATAKDVPGFVKELGKLRLWSREPGVKHGKASIPVK